MTFGSLRWRIASFYAFLLIAVIAVVTSVLTIELRSILLDEARAKIDRVGGDIAGLVHGDSALSAMGDTTPIVSQLMVTGALDHWAGPTTYVEIDTARGYPVAKSLNLGGALFPTQPIEAPGRVAYATLELPQLGRLLVRAESVREPGVSMIVRVGESLDIFDETLRRIRTLLAFVVVAAIVAVVVGSFAIASSAVGPIARLSAAMGEITSDRLSRRLGWSARRDELGSLATSFDAMLDRLEDGFARERQFISDASHELKTPLTVINANAQMLERWADREPEIRSDSLAAIRSESAALARMVNGMLLLARAESGEGIPREPMPIARAIDESLAATSARAAEKHLALAFEAEPADRELRILADPTLLRQLFTNLIDNAIKFTEAGRVDIALAREGERAVVSIADTGPGIDEAVRERIFDRFYRTDASRDRAVPGTGLGLAIVRSIARVHGGTVEASANPGGGTLFRVALPIFTALQ